MNVRIVPRDHPERTLLFAGVVRVYSTGDVLVLASRPCGGDPPIVPGATVPLRTVAEILLDEDPGGGF